MNLFICYARVDRPYCAEIVNTLSEHDVWFDQRLYAGDDWWKEILRRLDWCEGFIYLMSPASIASQYCRKELEIAMRLKRPIFPVLVSSKTQIPSILHGIHHVDITRGLTAQNVGMLLNSIYRAEKKRRPNNSLTVSTIDRSERTLPTEKSLIVVNKVLDAIKNRNYDDAAFMLRAAKNKGIKFEFIDVDELLQYVESMVEREIAIKGAIIEYKNIYKMFRVKDTREFAIRAFEKFRNQHPNYDPKNLHARIQEMRNSRRIGTNIPSREPAPKADGNDSTTITRPKKERQRKPASRVFTLPMLHWCHIPAGIVRNEDFSSRARIIEVPAFRMSKYAITNEQFNIFVRDKYGYQYHKWWEFSASARQWHQHHRKPYPPENSGYHNPRERVSWYEAVAFCYWLSARTGMKIMLPYVAQWQRAVQGDDEWLYPWGNTFNATLCNTQENPLKTTAPVDYFEGGASKHGVFGLVGDVWEWCIDRSEERDENGEYKRAAMGGSYLSSQERAQSTTRFFLNPKSVYGSIGFRIVTPVNSASLNGG